MSGDAKFALLAIALISAVGAAGVFFVGRWKARYHEASAKAEVSVLQAAAAERTVATAKAERDAAKSETAMCRRAIEHADRAVENLETALKEARKK